MNTAVDTFVYLPPLILAALVTVYRNTILCFWDCNPAVLTVKDAYHQVMVRVSQLGLLLQQFPSDVFLLVKFSLGLVFQTIKDILITLYVTFVQTLQTMFVTRLESVKVLVTDYMNLPSKNMYMLVVICLILITSLAIGYAATRKTIPQAPKVPEKMVLRPRKQVKTH